MKWLVLVLAIATPVYAHAPYSAVAPIPGIEGVMGDTHSGYGYFATSEAQGAQDFQFGCTQDDQRGYLGAYCRRDLRTNESVERILTDSSRALVLKRVQQQLYEYLFLQAKALKKAVGRPEPGDVPACLTDLATSPPVAGDRLPAIRDMRGMDLSSVEDFRPDTYDFDAEALDEPQKSIATRYKQVSAQFNEQNLTNAMVFTDGAQATLNRCTTEPPSTASTATENDRIRQAQCRDLPDTLRRARAAYPALELDQQARTDMRDSVLDLVGTKMLPNGTAAQRHQAGTNLYINTATGGGNDFKAFNDEVRDAFRDSTKPGARYAKLRAAAAASRAKIRVVQNKAADAAQAGLAGMCGKSLDDILRQYPNVARQAVLDMDPGTRGLAKTVLCRTTMLGDIRGSDNRCVGVTGGPLPSATPVRVSRYESFFPFVNNTEYTITRPTTPAGAPTVIDLQINLVPDPDVSAADLQTMVTRNQTAVQDWYSCQSGSLGQPQLSPPAVPSPIPCPPEARNARTPPVQFRVHLVPNGTGRPQIAIHRCYHASMPNNSRSDCAAIDAYHRRECAAAGSAAERTTCLTTANERDGGGRPNSGNYGINIGPATVAHEAAHLMGLDDEYQQPDVPFNRLGEHDSMMNASNNPGARFYPRHIDKMLAPGACRGGT